MGKICMTGMIGNFDSADTSDATALSSDIIEGKTAYVNGEKITGNIQEHGSETESCGFDYRNINPNSVRPGVPDALCVRIEKGAYLKQTTTGSTVITVPVVNKTITPSSEQQQITGDEDKILRQVTVKPIPENFVDTTGATATADDLLVDSTAYVNGDNVIGIIPKKRFGIETNMVDGAERFGFNGFPEAYYYHDTTQDEIYVTPEISISKDTVQEFLGVDASKIVEGEVIAGITGIAPSGNGIDTSDATATASDIVSPKTAYVNGTKITGNLTSMNSYTQADGWDYITETISPGQSPTFGRAIFFAIPKGVYNKGFVHSSWDGPELPTIWASVKNMTVTPNEYNQTYKSDSRIIESITVKPIPSNYVNPYDATATSEDILSGKVAYTKDGKITGTLEEFIPEFAMSLYPTYVNYVYVGSGETDEEESTEGTSTEEGEAEGSIEEVGEAEEEDSILNENSDVAGTDIEVGVIDITEPRQLIASGFGEGSYNSETTIYITDEQLASAMDIQADKLLSNYSLGGVTGTIPIKGPWEPFAGKWWDDDNNRMWVRIPNGAYVNDISENIGYSAISLPSEIKTVTPSRQAQDILASDGDHILRRVTVNPIPSNFIRFEEINNSIIINEDISMDSFTITNNNFIFKEKGINQYYIENIAVVLKINRCTSEGDINFSERLYFSEEEIHNSYGIEKRFNSVFSYMLSFYLIPDNKKLVIDFDFNYSDPADFNSGYIEIIFELIIFWR